VVTFNWVYEIGKEIGSGAPAQQLEWLDGVEGVA